MPMTNDERKELLNQLHDTLIKRLLAKIDSGEATAADFTLAWKMLQDNGVQMENLKEGLASLRSSEKSLLDEFEPTDGGPIAKIG